MSTRPSKPFVYLILSLSIAAISLYWSPSSLAGEPVYKLLQLPNRSGYHSHVAFSPDSQNIWTAESGNGTIRAWSITSGKKRVEVKPEKRVVWTHVAAMNDTVAFLADQQGAIWSCSVRNHKIERIIGEGEEVRALSFDARHSRILIVRADGKLECVEIQRNRVSKVVRQMPLDAVRCAKFSRTGERVAVAGWGGSTTKGSAVNVFTVKDVASVWHDHFRGPIADLAFGNPIDLIVIGQRSGICRCIDTRTKHEKWQLACRAKLSHCDISPKGDRLYVTSGMLLKFKTTKPRAVFCVYRTSDGKSLHEQQLSGNTVADLQVSSDGQNVSVAAGGRLWLRKMRRAEKDVRGD